jgi:hypothetical protein
LVIERDRSRLRTGRRQFGEESGEHGLYG